MNHGFQYEVREANPDEWEDAMALAWRTFQRFEAHEDSPEGVKNFLDFISDNTLRKMFMIGEYHFLGEGRGDCGWANVCAERAPRGDI